MKRATGWDGADKVNPSISIHALVKRATSFHCLYNTPLLYFNPRPREEGDRTPANVISTKFYFNPRPREEGDVSFPFVVVVLSDFNPRPREEGDMYMVDAL